MAKKDAQIRARVDAELKEDAEKVLDSLGLTPSAAINMYYRQIVHRRAIPFEVALPGRGAEERTAEKAVDALQPRPADRLTYGDFPHLFWNAEPGARLDLDDPTTFARFLTRGDPETVFRVVSLDEIAGRLPDLPLQPETRAFWERFVRAAASG
jgi:addiction module RelB/DinJ family antitoxin